MAEWIKAVTDPLKAASDLAQGLMDLRDITKLGSVVIKLNAEIIAAQRGALTAQQNEATMAEEIRGLKAKIVSFEDWDRKKERYELKEHGERKALAYALKEGVQPTEQAHSICPDCYEKRERTIVQEERYEHGRSAALVCNVCGWKGYTWGHAPSPAPSRRR